jgi:Uma2 family endonuclease
METLKEAAMATVQVERPLTYDDLRQMPEDRNRYEIINGVLFVSPSPNRAHQLVSIGLFKAVSAYVDANKLGVLLYAPVDVRLGPHNVVEPDLLFLRSDRFHLYEASGIVEGPPDLVVEIVSPSTTRIDAIDKAALYASTGVPEYWLLNPAPKTFRLLVLGPDGTYHDAKPIAGRFHSTVIAGLVINPEELFGVLGH